MAFRHDARHQAAAVRLWRVCHRTHPSDWAPRRGMGLAGAARRRAAAFAFGAPQGWQRFALFVLASDGALLTGTAYLLTVECVRVGTPLCACRCVGENAVKR